MDVEIYLLSIEQEIFKHNVESLGRIGSSGRPDVYTTMRRDKRHSPRVTIEQNLEDRQGSDIRKAEIIPLFDTSPWWKGSQIFIDQSAENAQTIQARLIGPPATFIS